MGNAIRRYCDTKCITNQNLTSVHLKQKIKRTETRKIHYRVGD